MEAFLASRCQGLRKRFHLDNHQIIILIICGKICTKALVFLKQAKIPVLADAQGEKPMNRVYGKVKKNRMPLGIAIILVVIALITPGPQGAALASSGDDHLVIGATILGVLATSLIGYGIYENLPSRQGKERLLNGEFYVGGYVGGAITPAQDLRYPDGTTLNGAAGGPRVTVRNNSFDPGVVVGLKLGYFFRSCPYLGLEGETNFNPSQVPRQRVALNRVIGGSSQATMPSDDWVNWTLALHIVGRYGFLPDKEVPFGRLQPYVGIGPGFVINYEEVDSAKNFSLDVMGGVRYMLRKNVSAFVEYKFSQLWDAEIEAHAFQANDLTVVRGTARLDYSSHKFVAGLAYHW